MDEDGNKMTRHVFRKVTVDKKRDLGLNNLPHTVHRTEQTTLVVKYGLFPHIDLMYEKEHPDKPVIKNRRLRIHKKKL